MFGFDSTMFFVSVSLLKALQWLVMGGNALCGVRYWVCVGMRFSVFGFDSVMFFVSLLKALQWMVEDED